jgi:hypothetical protein
MDLAICICTYKRPHLLRRLMTDLTKQTCLPKCLIVVDGDPSSGCVRREMEAIRLSHPVNLFYLPSNFANQPYQRYLGWKLAKQEKTDLLLYFDDDIHLLGCTEVENILQPFSWEHRNIAGVTARTIPGKSVSKLAEAPAVLEQKQLGLPSWLRWLGESNRTKPGGLTSTGQRIEPLYSGNSFVEVEWLQGRVMAFRMSFLEPANFPKDMFALKFAGAGLGEDTLISHSVHSRGQLLLCCDILIEHPDDDLPNSYPYKAYNYGFAVSYSRRLINDYFRWPDKPFLKDRISLVTSYVGNILLGWSRFFSRPVSHRFMYAAGYTVGAAKGIIWPPRSTRLAPNVDWETEAQEALQDRVDLSHG